ncbi:MAG: lamin tail domain-containing protein [Candidatus Kapabacteria bacterium]|nr:lamin tail domain-containing protein [Candidatus Kapabacteria bacterium]
MLKKLSNITEMKINVSLLIFLFFIIPITSKANLIINEVQPAPVGSEPEWVEIYNFDDDDFICTACLINDATNTKATIPDFTLKSKRFALLTKDSSALKIKRKIPEDCQIIQVSKIPTFNNTNDLIVIRNSDMTIIDSVYYDMKWGKAGISLERIDCLKPAVSKENWAASCSPDSATAGYENCQALRDFSVKILLSRDIDLNYIFNIQNTGRKSISEANFEVIADINNDNHFANEEKIYQGSILSLPKDNFVETQIKYNEIEKLIPRKGKFNCIFYLIINSKKDTLAKLYFDLYVSYPFNSIRFNEIMYDVSSDNSEYLEFYNTTPDTINLKNWFIANKQNRTKSDTFRISNEVSIEPKGYFLVAFDTLIFNKFPKLRGAKNILAQKSSFNLLVAGDKLIIADPNAIVMDSVNYEPSMHLPSLTIKKNVSLEKINVHLNSSEKKNWSSSRDEKGGTPGKPNSIYEISNPNGLIIAKPNPFSPYSQGNDTHTEIQYELPFKDALITAKIFDTAGFLVYEPINNRISASIGSFQWNGRTKNDEVLPPGQYIVLFQASDTETNEIWESKIVVVIGK